MKQPFIADEHASLPYDVWTNELKVSAVDVPGMERMTASEYREYISQFLAYVDHHDTLRSAAAGYPIACNKQQLDMLIEHLTKLRSQMSD